MESYDDTGYIGVLTMDKKKLGVFYAVLTSFFIQTAPIIAVLMLRESSPLISIFYFFLGSFVMSSLYILYRKDIKIKKVFLKNWKSLLIISSLHAIAAVTWIHTIDLIGPSLTIFLMRFIILFTIILGFIFLNERFTKYEALGLLITIIGAIALTYTDGFLVVGAFMAIFLSLVISIANLVAKVTVKKVKPLILNHFRVTFAPMLILIYILLTSEFQLPSQNMIILSLVGGALVGVVAFVLYFKSMELIDVSKAAVVRSLDPFIVVIYSFVILGDLISAQQFIGGTIIVLGILILAIAQSRHKTKVLDEYTRGHL